MKRVRICLVIMASLIVMSIISVMIIHSECDELYAITTQIQEYVDDNDTENAIKKADELEHIWQRNYKVFRCITSNPKIFDLNELIARIKPNIIEDNQDLSSDLNSILYNLDFISNKETPHIYNIF